MINPFAIVRVSRTAFPWLFAAASGLPLGCLSGLPTIAQSPPMPLAATPIAIKPLLPVATPERPALDEALWQSGKQGGDRAALLKAIDNSLRYLQTGQAAAVYQRYLVPGVTLERVERSLRRFRQLLVTTESAAALQHAIAQEFVFYKSTGKDGRGTVGFTGYYEAVYPASRVRTPEFRYPLFRVPANFGSWQKPQPTRQQLEGADGLQYRQGRLQGAELVWLRDRLEAFLVQVQGSARLTLTDGTTMTIGYAGHTDYPYTGVGRELVKAGKFRLEELTLPRLVQYFKDYPADLDVYLPRNQRFVFFRETGGAPATGSLGVPVTAGRSIATDKAIFPPGALALIQTQLPIANATGALEQQAVSRFVLDQDTGGAIKGAGRVDVFMGTGQPAVDRAGLINASGTLYYLLLKQ